MVQHRFIIYNDAMDENEPASELVYKWTIRTLYTAAIALNVWYLAETYRDTPKGAELVTKLHQMKNRALHPWRERKHFRRQANEVMVEAWVIVDEAKKGTDNE